MANQGGNTRDLLLLISKAIATIALIDSRSDGNGNKSKNDYLTTDPP